MRLRDKKMRMNRGRYWLDRTPWELGDDEIAIKRETTWRAFVRSRVCYGERRGRWAIKVGRRRWGRGKASVQPFWSHATCPACGRLSPTINHVVDFCVPAAHSSSLYPDPPFTEQHTPRNLSQRPNSNHFFFLNERYSNSDHSSCHSSTSQKSPSIHNLSIYPLLYDHRCDSNRLMNTSSHHALRSKRSASTHMYV